MSEDAHGFAEVDNSPNSGHNQPPAMRTFEDLPQHIATAHAVILQRAADLLAAEARMPAIVDDDTESKATDYIRAIQKCETELDALRLGEKSPYDRCSELIHTTFRRVQDKLVAPSRHAPPSLKERVSQKLKAYKDAVVEAARKKRVAEQAAAQAAADEARRKREAAQAAADAEARRIREAAEAKEREAQAAADALAATAARKRNEAAKARAEEDAAAAQAVADRAASDRRAAEEKAAKHGEQTVAAARKEEDKANATLAKADKSAAAKPAEMSRSRGHVGGISSLRTIWTFRDLKREELDLEALREHIPSDALEQAVRSFIKAGGRTLPGVVIFQDTDVTTR